MELVIMENLKPMMKTGPFPTTAPTTARSLLQATLPPETMDMPREDFPHEAGASQTSCALRTHVPVGPQTGLLGDRRGKSQETSTASSIRL
jgi:hypothetical protein